MVAARGRKSRTPSRPVIAARTVLTGGAAAENHADREAATGVRGLTHRVWFLHNAGGMNLRSRASMGPSSVESTGRGMGMAFGRCVAAPAEVRPVGVRSWILFAALVLSAVGFWIRLPFLDAPLNDRRLNQDATSHVLATSMALRSFPFAEHHLLPVFTAPGRDTNRGIDNLPGASVTAPSGLVFYTSWPPGMFVVPHLLSLALDVEPTPRFLRGLNLFLQAAAALLLASLCALVASRSGAGPDRAWAAWACGLLVGVTSPQAMESHLFAYWGTTLYAPLLLTQTILFLRGRVGAGFAALSLLGCLVDWTAYVAAVGFAFAEPIRRRLWGAAPPPDLDVQTGASRAAAALLLPPLVAIAATMAWWASLVPIADVVAAMSGRAGVRAGDALSLLLVPFGWLLSFGPFLPAAALGLLALRDLPPGAARAFAALAVAVAAAPIAENFAMSQHAVGYAFDRLKFGHLLAVLIAFGVAADLARARVIVAAVLGAAIYTLVSFAPLPPDGDELGRSYVRFGNIVRATLPIEAVAATDHDPARGMFLVHAGANFVHLPGPESGPRAAVAAAGAAAQARGRPVAVAYLWAADRASVTAVWVSADGGFAGRIETFDLSDRGARPEVSGGSLATLRQR